MTLEKSKLKMRAIEEVIEDLEAAKRKAESSALVARGATDAFAIAAKTIEALMLKVNERVDKEEFDLVQAKAAKDFLKLAAGAMLERRSESRTLALKQKTEAGGIKNSIEIARKRLGIEEGKAEASKFAEGEEGEAVIGGPMVDKLSQTGARPGMTIKQRRLAEEAEGKASEPPPEPEKASEPKGKAKPKKKAPAPKKAPKKATAKKTSKKPTPKVAKKRGGTKAPAKKKAPKKPTRKR